MSPEATPAQAFGLRLRQLRREKSAEEHRDVEQGELAAAVDDTQPNVARWERGRIPKDVATVRRLADFYAVNWIWLLHGEGTREIEPIEAEGELVARPAPHASRRAVVPPKAHRRGSR